MSRGRRDAVRGGCGGTSSVAGGHTGKAEHKEEFFVNTDFRGLDQRERETHSELEVDPADRLLKQRLCPLQRSPLESDLSRIALQIDQQISKSEQVSGRPAKLQRRRMHRQERSGREQRTSRTAVASERAGSAGEAVVLAADSRTL